MPALTSLAYPNAVLTMIAMLETIEYNDAPVPARVAPPPGWDGSPLFVIQRVGGGPDPDDTTDYPVVLVSSFGEDYMSAVDLSGLAQVRILSSPMTEVGGVLVDSAAIYVGEQEIPDVYPDERRFNSTYRMGWRRQFRP